MAKGSSGFDKNGNKGTISSLAARVAFNAAKKSDSLSGSGAGKRDKGIEKAIRSGDEKFIDSIKTEKEARRVSDYLQGRKNETQKKIVKLGSAEKLQKNSKLYNENKNVISLLNAAREKVGKLRDTSDIGVKNPEIKYATTTYQRARKKRIERFNEWFGKR